MELPVDGRYRVCRRPQSFFGGRTINVRVWLTARAKVVLRMRLTVRLTEQRKSGRTATLQQPGGMGRSALLPLLLFFYLLSVTGVNCQYSEPQNDGAASDKFSLLESALSVPRLQVVRGLHAPLLKSHLPIMNRVLKGHVCRIEVEEYAPLFSVVGHLEPKKFDCSFRDGDVTYYHEGNPLLNSDTVRVTIFFFRNNYSIIQTADIAVDIIDPRQPKTVNLTVDGGPESSFKKVDGSSPKQSRLSGPQELHVEHVKALSEAIDPAALQIFYDADKEDCRISYTSPELTLNAPTEKALEQISGHPYQTFWWEPNAGLWSPRMGRPLASGAAIGGSRRWPLFGQVVAFNRTDVKHFDHECQEGLLKGYRYLHRKTDSPGTDYIPIQVTIWKRLPDGKRQLVQRESKYLPVKIAGARPLTPPTIRVFRQVNLTHIGGSFSVLPKDCIVVGTETASREDYLDINVTRIQGPLFAQLVNLRDPTRPVLSFRIQELRKGLIALQLLNYAEMQEKTFILTLVAIDPFMQVSQPVDLRLVSHLQPVFRLSDSEAVGMKNPFVFQVFSLPLFSFTGATSIVQKYNIQIVGYIDEAIVRFHVLSNRDEMEYFSYLNNSVKFSGGHLQLNGNPLGRASFSLAEISAYQLAYAHPGGLQPSVDRFRLQLSTAALSDRRLFLRRSLRSSSAAGFDGRPVSRNASGWRQRQDNLHRSRTRRNYVAHSEIELPVRIVRLYENMKETALKLDSVFRVYHGTAFCFNADALLTQDSLQAARSDFVDLLFAVKVQPTQGTLIRRSKLLTAAAAAVNATGRMAQTVADASPTPRPSLSLDMEAEEAARIDLVRLSELENGDICYWNRRRDTRTDVIGLKQVGRLDFPTVAVNLDIQPKPRYQLSKQSNPAEVLHVRETANYVALNPTVLRHVLEPTRQWSLSARNLIPLMPSPSDVVYTVTRHPRFAGEEGPLSTQDAGRLVSLSAVSSSSHEGDTALRPGLATHLRDLSPPAVDWFTQAQVDSGDVVFVPPIKDVGPQDRNVSVQLAVSAPGINILTEEVLLIRILAEDNQTPNLELIKPVSVTRDGELPLTEEVLRLADQDTPFVNLKLTLVKRPAHGDIFVRRANTTVSSIGTKVKMSENDTFEASLLPMSALSYIQDGSNTKEDSFILTATDGKQTSQPLVVTVAIHPRVLHQPVWKLLVNNSILVWENASVTLHQSVFPQSDTGNDSSPHDSRFFLVVAPTKGRLVLDGRKTVNQFSNADVTNSRIAYRHGPAEIGIKPQVDIARIWDFRSGKIFSLNFTLTPVNSQAPKLVSKTALHVKEGKKVVLGSQILSVYDVDTEEENINIRLIHPPRWGHLELCIENVTINTSQDNAAFAFTARDLMDSRVWYVNSRHAGGQESAGDVFSVRAYDEAFASAETLEIKVIIQPMNDEVPVVRLLNHFSVPEGGRRILTPHLFAVSDRDVPRDILQIHFPQLPTYGVLSVYWHYGERHVITAHSAPIAETYLGMLNLLYVQNSSLLPRTDASDGRYPSFSSYGPHVLAVDQFTVSVSDGLHEVVKTARILIRRPNRMKPSVISDHSSGVLTLTGTAWKLLNALPGGLRVVDEDSADEDVLVRLTRAPRLGHLERLPRRTSVENDGAVGPDDLIEAAWDAEEKQAERLGISKMELRNAGSIGGGKSAKTLGEGDGFTKRQLDSDRIYYIYTGEYTSDFVYDSCELHVTDGSYEIGPITIQFRIRGTHGRPHGPSVYSQSQFMDRNYQEDRPLSDDAFSQTPSWTFNEELNAGDATESTVFEAAEITPSPDQILYTADGNKLRIQSSTLEVALGHRSTLTAGHVQMEVLSPTNDSLTNLILSSRFEVYKIRPEQGSEMELPREMDDCVAVVEASQPRETVMKFSYKDLVSGKIAVSAENCTTVPPVKFGLTLLLTVPGQRPVTLFIPLALHPHARSRIPRLIVGDPLRVIPGTDVPLTAAQLQLATDGGNENFDPTKIYLFAADGFTSHGGYLHRRGSCNGMVAAVDLFSLFEVGNEDIIYHSPDPPLSYSSPPQPIPSSSIPLMVVNLQELELALDMVHLRAFVASLVAEARTDRTVSLLQYFLGGSDKSTVQPLKLWFEPVEEEIYQLIADNETASIHAVAPLAEKLTKVYDGYMGFFLSAEHLFARGNPSDITYTVVGTNTGESGRNIISLETGEVLSRFSQADVNRRRLAYSISYTLSYAASSKRRLKERQDKGTFQNTLSLAVSRAARGNGVGNINSTVSLTFTWAELGFQRKRYRICASSGTLSLELRRRGALNHKVEAYLGLAPTADLGLTEVDLLSPKLVHFASGEDSKIIKVRVHHPQGNPEKPRQSKGYFGVTVKAPTAAVLGDNNEAQIIITSNKQCQTSSFFTPHEPAKTMKSTSLGLELPDTPKSKARMSLTEWLTSNSLPDSNTLSKVYSLTFKKRSATVCDEGWSLYQHRCYRFFPHHNTTWLDARNYCEQQKGYLASVTGPEFNDWIRTRLTVRAPVWIGLHKQILDGGWLWHSLEQSDYTNWEQGFPQRTRPRRRRIPKRKDWHPFMNAVDTGAREDNTRRRYRLASHQSRRRTQATAPVLWQSSAASHERTKRWTEARHSSSRGEPVDLVLQPAPKFCVLLGDNLGWQNQPCMRTRVPFICMKNPKVN